MSTKQKCYSSFWTRDADKIFENTLAIYSKDINLLTKIQEALPGKLLDDILDHYNILVEDVKAIESGLVPLPNYPKMQGDSSKKSSKADVERQRGTPWTEEEHRSFLRGLEIYEKGDWRSISRHCVMTRTPMQVATHSQKFFKRLNATKKGNRKPRAKASVLDITSVDVEAAGTSQVRTTVDMIGHACRGSQTLPTTNNESMLPGERTNAEQMIAVAGGESSDHNVALINGMNSLFPYAYDEFIIGIDDLIMEQEDVNEPENKLLLLLSYLPVSPHLALVLLAIKASLI
ncbi:transcription factor DIVARICATA-like [Solanum tuberosum]|uniref:I-box binding factor n=1 Tax=Solanum tuberosum TaxID=4113 RepID=M1B1V7_SOLTU|nr:PREDICTED: transcription factor DIVARICATA-like [Solanum tuberosum]